MGSGGSRKSLSKLIRERAQALRDEALRNDGQLSPQELADLEQLELLLKIREATRPPSRRWPVYAALLFTFLIISVLLTRISKTEIELEIRSTGLQFELLDRHPLIESMTLSELGVPGLIEARLPYSHKHGLRTLRAKDKSWLSVDLVGLTDKKVPGNITLSDLVLESGTNVSLYHLQTPYRYRLYLKSESIEKLSVGIGGRVAIRSPGLVSEEVEFLSPRTVELRTGSHDINLDLTLYGSAPHLLSSQIPAKNLTFRQLKEFFGEKAGVVRNVSTILDGSLYFMSLNAQERKIRLGEFIQFESCEGQIRALTVDDDHIKFQFFGWVRGMHTGTKSNPQSLMPTRLEWLHAQHGLKLFWGTILYLFGMIMVVLRYWRVVV